MEVAAPETRALGPWPPGQEVRLLVPIIRAQTATALMDVGDALANRAGTSGEILGLVEIPSGRPDGVAETLTGRRRDLLRWIAATDRSKPGARLAIQMRVVHRVAQGIREVVYENQTNLIVIEWPGLGTRRPRALGSVLENLVLDPPADLILVRPDPGRLYVPDRGRILVALRGGHNAQLAAEAAVALARAHHAELTLLHVVEGGMEPAARARTEGTMRQLAARLGYRRTATVVRPSPAAAAILKESQAHDVTVIGAHADATHSPVLVGSELADTVRRLPGTVIIAKCREP
ncbi:MAG: universal stress protein [Candidatus Dormibacterales bacterium]